MSNHLQSGDLLPTTPPPGMAIPDAAYERRRFTKWFCMQDALKEDDSSMDCYWTGWLARSEQSRIVAVPSDAFELLHIWQTWLGADRSSCDEGGKMLWDRIDAVFAADQRVAPQTSPVARDALTAAMREAVAECADICDVYSTYKGARCASEIRHQIMDDKLAAIADRYAAQPPAVDVAVPDERAAFELFYAKEWREFSQSAERFSVEFLANELKEMRNGDKYGEHQDYLNFMWEGWQARAAERNGR